jgi:hypothetical protein
MRYDQSKSLAAQTIYKNMEPYLQKYQIKNVADLFCGTGEMSKILYHHYPLIMNDHMYHSCLIAEAQIIYYPEVRRRIELLNRVEPIEGMITKNYSLDERSILTKSNAMKIDAIRIHIEDWYSQFIISRNQYIKLMGVFLFCVDNYLNYIHQMDKDKEDIPDFKLQNVFDVDQVQKNYYLFSNEDILKLNLEKVVEQINFRMDFVQPNVKLDSAYLNLVHQRSKYSFLLETIARYEDTQIKEEIFNKNRLKELAKKLENVPLIFIRYNGGLKDMKIARIFEDLGRKVNILKIDLGRKKNQKNVIEEFLLVVE